MFLLLSTYYLRVCIKYSITMLTKTTTYSLGDAITTLSFIKTKTILLLLLLSRGCLQAFTALDTDDESSHHLIAGTLYQVHVIL